MSFSNIFIPNYIDNPTSRLPNIDILLFINKVSLPRIVKPYLGVENLADTHTGCRKSLKGVRRTDFTPLQVIQTESLHEIEQE